jgi:predicted metal-binding protein
VVRVAQKTQREINPVLQPSQKGRVRARPLIPSGSYIGFSRCTEAFGCPEGILLPFFVEVLSMATCRTCKADIVFKPHPQNPASLAPFDADGEIHFARCKSSSRPKKEYSSLRDILCHTCEEFAALVFIQPISNGSRLAYYCENLHRGWLPMTPKNNALVNATWEQSEAIQRIKSARYRSSNPYLTLQENHSARVQCADLIEQYRKNYGSGFGGLNPWS